MKKCIICFCLGVFALIISITTYGQQPALEGSWQGILIQPKGDITEDYAYWLELHQQGDSIFGNARTELVNTPYYAIIEYKGIVSGDRVTFIQTQINSSFNRPHISTWCLIVVDLVYNAKAHSLEGTWTSETPSCGSGTMLLYKSLKTLNKGATPVYRYTHLQELEAKLLRKEEVKGHKVVLTKVYFDVNQAAVKLGSAEELATVKALLLKYPSVKINIQGHTDDRGSDALNMKLSYERAKEIYTYLVKQHIDPSRMTYEGYGKARPMVSNETETGKAKNRRVEIEIVAQ